MNDGLSALIEDERQTDIEDFTKGSRVTAFSIDRNALVQATSCVAGTIRQSDVIPILHHILIHVGEGAITLTATDMERIVVTTAPAEVTRKGAFTIPAAILGGMATRLPAGSKIEIAHDGTAATIRSGRARSIVPTLPVEDFPVLAVTGFTHTFMLPAKTLNQLLYLTEHSVSDEETRYYLCGHYLEAREDGLGMVSTNSHVLTSTKCELPSGAAGMEPIIIPARTGAELMKLLKGATGDVAVSVSNRLISFVVGAVTFSSKLIDGTYPDYRRVVPRRGDNVLTVDKAALLNALGLAGVINGGRSAPVALDMAAGRLIVSAPRSEAGESEAGILGGDAEYQGVALRLGFQSRYLREIAMRAGDRLELAMTDAQSAALCCDPADDGTFYVLMPLRL